MPTASMTNRRSSAHPSSVGVVAATVLDAPHPRASNSTTRLNDDSRRTNSAAAGASQIRSTGY
jgi:hypothetical protein